MPSLNCLLRAPQRMAVEQGGARPPWPLLSQATGKPAAFGKANGPGKRWLGEFLGSGTRELQTEIARAWALRATPSEPRG